MELKAEKRSEIGKKSKKLSRTGKIPAVMFGKGLESTPLTLSYPQFEKVYKEAGESTLVDVKIDNESAVKVLISGVARNPVTDKLTHADLHKVNLKEHITATVPLNFVGESPAVKSGEGLLLTLIDEVAVEALPQDLPHDIKVDISGLTAIEQGIYVKELPIDHSKVKILHHEPEELVVKIDYAEMKEEEAPVEAVPTEAELVAKVEATEQLTEEEKLKRAEAEKEKKGKEEE